ncbi:MAG TPA: cupin domain-containing protein [Glycomyces sp.]
MDVLSDVLAVLRTGRPFAVRQNVTAPFAYRRRSPNGFGVQIMVRGNALVTTEDGKVIEVAEGDVLVVPRGSAHTSPRATCSSCPAAAPTRSCPTRSARGT